MKIIDLNILLYAVNADSPHHARVRPWLEGVLSSDESVALPWAVILGFLRIATHPRVLTRPIKPDEAIAVVDSWLSRPNVVALAPTDEHWAILKEGLLDAGTAGNLTTDAHLAALAIEHAAELCSTDTDFARFNRLRWTNPIGR
jgi:toxin-antitoxin system PIN domain toxin